MNRHERRAAQAQARKREAHPNQSFTDLVSQKNVEALKPFVFQMVQGMAAQLARQQLAATAGMLTRLSVLEELAKDKLGETDDSLAERVAVREDDALRLVASTEPAKEGDMVRVSLRGGVEGDVQNGEFVRAVLRKLATEPMQFHPELEKGIVGMSTGETKTITIEGSPIHSTDPEQDGKAKTPNLVFEVRVNRISVPKAKPETAAPATSEGEENAAA